MKIRLKAHQILCIYFLLCFAGCFSRFALVRIAVVDSETKSPIPNSTINCVFYSLNFDTSGKVPPKHNSHSYKSTGSDNIKWLLGHGNDPSVSACLDRAPNGYYIGQADHTSFWKISYLCPIPIWLPPVRTLKVTAHKKQNPTTLKHGIFYDPHLTWKKELGTNDLCDIYAYDCLAGDWCPPHGKGQIKDFIVVYSYKFFGTGTNRFGRARTFYRKERTISFSNPYDGLMVYKNSREMGQRPSDLTAPTNGYQPSHSSYFSVTQENDWDVSDETFINFFFRIRTQCDSNGNIVSGLYGKFSGCYSFYLSHRCEYFLNPTPLDRNLEY